MLLQSKLLVLLLLCLCLWANRTVFMLQVHIRKITVVFVHRRERSKVPYIVRQCIEEVEKRGIDEVGIYRISGVATDIQALKLAFDTSKTPFTVFVCQCPQKNSDRLSEILDNCCSTPL